MSSRRVACGQPELAQCLFAAQPVRIGLSICVNKSLGGATLPISMQPARIDFWLQVHQRSRGLTLPRGLQTLTLGDCSNHSLNAVTLRSWEGLVLRSGLYTLIFSYGLNQSFSRDASGHATGIDLWPHVQPELAGCHPQAQP